MLVLRRGDAGETHRLVRVPEMRVHPRARLGDAAPDTHTHRGAGGDSGGEPPQMRQFTSDRDSRCLWPYRCLPHWAAGCQDCPRRYGVREELFAASAAQRPQVERERRLPSPDAPPEVPPRHTEVPRQGGDPE